MSVNHKNLFFFITWMFLSSWCFGKQLYLTRDGEINFFSSTPIEDIKAVNNQVSCVLNKITGDFAFQVPIKGFRFKNALMQEHFNENYLESDIYPKSVFKGKISDWENIDVSSKPVDITIEGEPISNGDWVGVFYMNDATGEMVCGGSTIWTGETTSIAAWGAEGGDNGFESGETLTWGVYDSETETYITGANVSYTFGASVYSCNGLSGIGSIEAVSTFSQSIPLTTGWGIWSTFIDPDDTNMSSVFSDIVNDLIIVKDEAGNVYWPMFGLNSIGSLTKGKGYQVKMESDATLEIEGNLVPYDFDINLDEGWGITGYLHQECYSAVDMMSSVVNNLTILKDEEGNVYWPMFGLNSIGNMCPGKGYQIKMENSTLLNYPSSGGVRYGDIYVERPVHFDEPVNTGNNMIIGLPLNSWETTPSIGDEIAAYGEDGTLIGSTTFQGDHIALSIWGDDLTTNKKEGISEGETISFKLWNSQTGVEQALEVRWSQGVGFYTTDGISVAGQIILGSELTTEKQLVKITDVLGREVDGDER